MRIKKAIILTITALLTIGNLHAQKLELGLHGGIGFSTVPQAGRDSVIPASASALANYAVSIKALTNVGEWQFGAGIDFQKISAKFISTKYIFANPASTVYLEVNKEFAYYFYAGLNAGLLFVSSANYTRFSDNNKLVPEIVYMEPGNGYAAGLHIGMNYYLTHFLNVAAELGCKYGSYKYQYSETDKFGIVTTGTDYYSFFYPSLVVGLRLKLFTDPFNQWLPYRRVR